VTGRLLQIAIRGQRTGLDSGPGFVYLPPQYFQPAYQRMRFPVVVALTGYPGRAGGLVHRLELPMVAARLLAARQIKPSVFVMLGVSPLMPLDTECTDIPAGPQVESFLAQDVPHAIQQAFRVTTSPAGWGVIGYSTGGYCATKLAMMYPDRYSAAVSMAGYYRALRGQFVPNLWGGSLAYRLENSPDWRLRHLPAPPVSILATSSKVGERSLPGTLTFLREIHPPMRGYSLIIPQGGHNFLTWNRELVPSLEWLSRRLV
jgi:S-formylglutathione hydrolase FrmB